MRRSVREALVGLFLLAAAASGFGLWLWLKGISLSRNTWTIRADFLDAAGLAARSPVTFRGVMVGSVRQVRVGDQVVSADLEITDPELRLSRPVVARVGPSSLLGGESQVYLISAGQPLPAGMAGPQARDCDRQRLVCNGGTVKGDSAASLQSVTEKVQELLDQARRTGVVPRTAQAITSVDKAARQAEKLSRDGQVFLADARGVVADLRGSVKKADPILANLRRASADAASASRHVNNITAAVDNPQTLADLKQTLANARQLSARIDSVSGDLRRLTADPTFMNGVRSVTVGLGKFFDELYPGRNGQAPAAARPAPQPQGRP